MTHIGSIIQKSKKESNHQCPLLHGYVCNA